MKLNYLNTSTENPTIERRQYRTHRFKWAFVHQIQWRPKQILKCPSFT